MRNLKKNTINPQKNLVRSEEGVTLTIELILMIAILVLAVAGLYPILKTAVGTGFNKVSKSVEDTIDSNINIKK